MFKTTCYRRQCSGVTIVLAWLVLLPVALSSNSSCRWFFDFCEHRPKNQYLGRCIVKLLKLNEYDIACGRGPHVKFINIRSKEGRNYRRFCNNNIEYNRRQCYARAIWCPWGPWSEPLSCDYTLISIDLKRTRRKCCHPTTRRRDSRLRCKSWLYLRETDYTETKPDDRSRCKNQIRTDNKRAPSATNLISSITACVSIFIVVVVCQCVGFQMRKARRRRFAQVRDELLRGQATSDTALPGPVPASIPNAPPPPPPVILYDPPNPPCAPPDIGDGTVLPPSYEEAARLPEVPESPPPQYDVALKLVT